MNKRVFSIMALLAYILAACGPNAAQQTATVEMATDLAVDSTFEAILEAKQTVQGLVTEEPCVPPASPEDPFYPATRLLLDKWESWDGTTRSYDTAIGTYGFEYHEGYIVITNPASQQLQELRDRRLIGSSPTANTVDGSKLMRLGPIFFYRCGQHVYINDQYIDRVATIDVTPMPGG